MYRAPVFFSLFVTALLIGKTMFGQVPKVTTGKIVQFAKFESAFVDARNIDVWLPDGYAPDRQYPVLYMHDGQMLFDSTINWNHTRWGVDEKLGALIAQKKVRACIVVGIWNTHKRHPEYFPQAPFYTMTKADQERMLAIGKEKKEPLMGSGPVSDNYLKFIVNELKPFIDKHFSTLSNTGSTYIAGSSMGGLISLYAICKYPGVFGGAACLSTHWTGIFTTVDNPIPAAFLKYLKTHLPSPKSHKIYFDYGTETLDAMYKPYQQQADAIMKEGGYGSANWETLEFRGENHTEKAWNKRLDIPLLFLLDK